MAGIGPAVGVYQGKLAEAQREDAGRLLALEALRDEAAAVRDMLAELPTRLSHRIMVPYGRVAFFPGTPPAGRRSPLAAPRCQPLPSLQLSRQPRPRDRALAAEDQRSGARMRWRPPSAAAAHNARAPSLPSSIPQNPQASWCTQTRSPSASAPSTTSP
jgi:hypothetical protein